MGEPSATNEESLTGVWQGVYSYPHLYDPVSFVAVLIESGASFSGTAHEPCLDGSALGGTLYATLAGERQDRLVTFLKTYDGTGGWHHSVEYEGRLNGDGTEIEGRWVIPQVLSGKFLMIRARGKEGSVERRVEEPIELP